MLWDVSEGGVAIITGKVQRLDQRGFPNKNGAVSTAVSYTSLA